MQSFNNQQLWSIVEEIVLNRGRKLKRYKFFEKVWEALERAQLLVLEAPPGAGKTEALHTPFLAGLRTDSRKWLSLVHTLPMRSLVENMFARGCKELKALGITNVVPTVDHGLAAIEPFLEGDLVFTTYDTLIYTMYGYRVRGYHVLMPLGKLIKSLVLLDEVQLLQDSYWYPLSVLPFHIGFLVELNSTVVLTTATLPEVLLQLIKEEVKRKEIQMEFVRCDEKPLRGALKVNLSNESLFRIIDENIERFEKPLLIVTNTVERAVKVYWKVRKQGYSPLLLHSRLKKKVRKEREIVFEGNQGPSLLVTTQVVEAGIDYDIRTVITDIAPIDSLIQRLGRCARYENGEAWICGFNKEDALESTKHVYPSLICERTLEQLDEDSLSKSVEDVKIAHELVSNVYTEEVIHELRRSIEIRNLIDSVSKFANSMASSEEIWRPRAFNKVVESLLRIGQEIHCLVLTQDDYTKLLYNICQGKCKIDWLKPDYIQDSSFSFSIQEKVNYDFLKHVINGEKLYLVLEFNNEQAFINKLTDLKNIRNKLKENSNLFLIVNPEYYEYDEGYDLGVIRVRGT
ncbi:MAG: CRISPR-associated helicase Cas3' [Ignisphaera sp.]